VALAAQAPAFAASTDPPTIAGADSFTACKDPGSGSNCQGYRFSLNLTVQPGDTWTISFTNVQVETTSLTAVTSPKVFTSVSFGNPTISFVTCTETDSASHHNVTLRYDATNNRTGVTTTNLGGTWDVRGIGPCPK
jgi:hypothetical protein